MIGILGGMGPLATADFFAKVLAATPVASETDHVPLLILSDPRIPPRPPAILGKSNSPLPALLAARDKLLEAGACALAMPCNTAHFWFRELSNDCPVPFISIVDASCAEVAAIARPGDAVGLIATRATLASNLYTAKIEALGLRVCMPDDATMTRVVLPAIEQVKRGQAKEGGHMLAPVVESLLAGGANAVILACTEIPLALDAIASPLRDRCVDSTAALARACVAFWRERE